MRPLNSLQSILKKRTLSPQKLDEVKIKANILSTFKTVEEKIEEVHVRIRGSAKTFVPCL